MNGGRSDEPEPDGRDLDRLVDYAGLARVGDWSLRSALVRFAQPEPERAAALLLSLIHI